MGTGGFGTGFLCTIAMWWLYFGTSSTEAEHSITSSADPGRMGAYFHYLHVVLVAGIIVTAVGMDILLEEPAEPATGAPALVLTLGPVLYLVASTVYRWVATCRIARAQVAGRACWSWPGLRAMPCPCGSWRWWIPPSCWPPAFFPPAGRGGRAIGPAGMAAGGDQPP
ncbi:low temperature requirement protein A [Komagataeibacter rhaeticus]|nr:low temperature requirement protein A [Komagataeibacter rhaeticus]